MPINLLPWRERQNVMRNRLFYRQVLMIGMISGSVILFSHFYWLHLIETEEKRWAYILQEEEKIQGALDEIRDYETMKANVNLQLKWIHSLSKDPIDILAWLERLSRVMPASTCLHRIMTKSKTLTLEGYAQTNGAISGLLKNLEGEIVEGERAILPNNQNQHLPQLVEVVADKKTPYLKFKIVISEGET